jgi:hypothetical protein
MAARSKDTNCLRSLELWDCGFEPHSRHGCLCAFIPQLNFSLCGVQWSCSHLTCHLSGSLVTEPCGVLRFVLNIKKVGAKVLNNHLLTTDMGW